MTEGHRLVHGELLGWWADGFALSTYAWNISDLTEPVAGKRGSDIDVARRPGRKWREKFPRSRTVTLGMNVLAARPDQRKLSTADRSRYQHNLEALRSLLVRYDRQVEVERRWEGPDGWVRRRFADCDAGELDTEQQRGIGLGKMTVDLTLAYPHWLGLEVSKEAPDGWVWHDGSAQTIHVVTRFNGPTSGSVSVANETTGETVTLTATLAAGEWVEVDTEALTTIDHDGQSRDADVDWDGVWPLRLDPGRNKLSASDAVTVTWQPAYLGSG